MPDPPDIYELTSLWLEGAGLVGWAALGSEMALDEIAPGAAPEVDFDLLSQPGPEA